MSASSELYREIIRTAGWVRRLDSDFMVAHGRDVLDFLNRISTNSPPKSMVTGEPWTTILTTDKAKIIDVVTVVKIDGEYLLEVSASNAGRVRSWITKYIITEDIFLVQSPFNLIKFSLFGKQANPAMERLIQLRQRPGRSTLTPGSEFFLTYPDPLFERTVWNLYMSENSGDDLRSTLSAIAPEAGAELFETFRIEQGSPAFGKELSDQVNPLEAGLHRYVSTSKGCYLGQEVIARIASYQAPRRKLFRLLLDDSVAPSSRVFIGETEVGWITSTCYSLRFARWLSLGYMKRSFHNAKITVRDDSNRIVRGELFEPPGDENC